MIDLTIRDVRLEAVKDIEDAARAAAPPARCRVCERKLPKGLQRSHCLEHSAYAQRLIQAERRRRARRARPAQQAA